jgi:hypothetical protein
VDVAAAADGSHGASIGGEGRLLWEGYRRGLVGGEASGGRAGLGLG